MANAVLRLQLETELLGDASRELAAIGAALAHCHGEAFRRLDRKIDALIESGDVSQLHELETAHFILGPSRALSDVIAEARSLGVI